MKIKLEMMCPCKIAYMRRVGAYGPENKVQMDSLKKWARDNGLLNEEAIILGIAQDDPSKVQPQACRYDVCIVIREEYKMESREVNVGGITEGKYVVFEVEHTAAAIQKAWGDIFQEIDKGGYRLDESRPIIERYQMEMVNNHLCEICMPIE